MAVAAHVSRVAKDYAPYGYSVMESISVTFTLTAGTSVYVPLVYADDADVYVEAGSLAALTAFGSEATNFWSFDLVYGPSGLGSETAVSSSTVGGTATVIAVNTISDFPIGTPVVPLGNTLYLKASAATGSSAVESVAALCRIRRKA